MKNYPKLTEEKIEEIIDKFLEENTINKREREILARFKENKSQGLLRRISDFKMDISRVQLSYGLDFLSSDILDFYTEIMRQYPSTGPSSIFNGLIK